MYYTTIEEAQEALRAAESDVLADFGEEGLEAGWYDVVHNIASFCKEGVARELLRMELGEGIFPDDPDPLIEVVLETDEQRERRLAPARERRNKIRSQFPLDGDHKWRK